LEAYRFGDLSRVYPIARGSAPVVVTMLAAVLAGEYPSAQGFAAIGLIAVGIMSLALNQGLDPVRDSRAALLALATGCIAAVYTVVDGLGARYIGSLSYMMWASLLDAVFFLPVVFFAKRGRLLPIRASTCLSGIVAGVIGFVAYWLIVWALSVAPMGPVSALRAAGIGFAVIFGAVVLKEPMTALKSAAIAAIAAGTAMLKLGK
jgi:drug/metabolite transporter (DMT)-like permease